ncbi:MAG: 5-(carboxyamino)imidazole ribonucleotide synthase [Alistipes sp.]
MKKIGIIGGGQLGLMIIVEAHQLGAQTVCLDPSEDAPAFALSDECVVGEFDDPQALEYLCAQSDVVTYEFENIPGDLLVSLSEKYNIKQGSRPLFDSQDRLREKDNAREHGLQTPGYKAVDDAESLRAAVLEMGFPCVLKTRTLGYDGHGQAVLKGVEDVDGALPMLAVPCILEEFVHFDFEASIVMVADDEQVVSFPVGRNIHKGGILDLCLVPAAMDDMLRDRLVAQSKQFMRACGYRGILAIEYFIRGEEILFNEMAPRPHNSGHYTIEGCTTNQFRELVRYLLEMPLEQPELVRPTVMKNILGEDLTAAERMAKGEHPDCYVHLYGKTVNKPKRKMGHITFVGMTAEEYMSEWAAEFVK